MDDHSSPRAALLTLPNFLLLLMVATGVYFYRPPLQSTRPDGDSSFAESSGRTKSPDTEFRSAEVPLSQDPFLVVEKVLDSESQRGIGLHQNIPIWKPQTESARGIRVIFAMTPAGQTRERVEMRLRARQAVLGALRSEGFTPVHPGFMLHCLLRNDFFFDFQDFEGEQYRPTPPTKFPPYLQSEPRAQLDSARHGLLASLSGPRTDLPRILPASQHRTPPVTTATARRNVILTQETHVIPSPVSDQAKDVVLPYEWFAQDIVASRAGYANSINHVLLMWIPEVKLGSENLAVLRQIVGVLKQRLRDPKSPGPAPSAPTPDTPPVPVPAPAAFVPMEPTGSGSSGTPVIFASLAPPAPAAEDSASFALVGPTASTTLLAMFSESTNKATLAVDMNPNHADLNQDLRVYAPTPSAEPFLMVPPGASLVGTSLGNLDDHFADNLGFRRFERICQTDDVIAQALVDELSTRGLRVIPTSSDWKIAQANDDGNRLDSIAMVCEHESLYGRAFPQTFNAILWHLAERDGKSYRERSVQWRQQHSSRPPNVHVYLFPQGVDASTARQDSQRESSTSGSTPSATAPRLPELPEGPGQLDYIRRLAQSLSNEYRRAGRNRLRAIGIIGSDVYDKILLLQALRVEFPDILFFSTDLDARLLHHTNFPYTHNLILASSYGLTLRDRYQRTSGIAAFRDSGQTATFVACRMALSDETQHDAAGNPDVFGTILSNQVQKSIERPIIFEVGSERTAVLSPLSQSDDSLHPPSLPTLGATYWVLVLVAVSLFLALAIYVLPPVRDRISFVFFRLLRRTGLRTTPDPLFDEGPPTGQNELERLTKKRERLLAGVVTIGTGTGILLFLSVPISHYFGGEPFALAAGYSSWPTIVISHVALLLTLYFLVESWYQLRSVELRAERQFGLAGGPTVSARSGLLLPLSVWSTQRRTDGKIDVRALWGQFKSLGTLSNRVARVSVLFGVLALFWVVMYFLFGEANDPFRGNLNWFLGRSVMLSAMTALSLLTLLVVDGTSLVLAFVRNLASGTSHYENESLRVIWSKQFTEEGESAGPGNVPGENLRRIEEYADVAIIGELTSSVLSILVYPFLTLTLLILSRSTLFDNFVWSTVLVAVYSMLFAYTLWSAVALQRTAERARVSAVSVARRKLDAVRRTPGEPAQNAAAIYEASIQQIGTLKSGAFMSLADNPILRAVLIPTGGTTLVTLFEYLARF